MKQIYIFRISTKYVNIHHDHKIQKKHMLIISYIFLKGRLLVMLRTFDSPKFNLSEILSVEFHFSISPLYPTTT